MEARKNRLRHGSVVAAGLGLLCALAIASGGSHVIVQEASDAKVYAVGGSHQSSQSATLRDAVALMRIVNAAEQRYRASFRSYASWDQLSESHIPETLMTEMGEHMKSTRPEPPVLNLGSPQPLSGYALSLYTSADRAHYISSLRPTADTDPCAVCLYTADDGVIQSAKTIGCQ